MNQHDDYEFHRERMEKEGEALEKEYEGDLHLKAGMTFGGLNDDGVMEWIGTDEQWDKFEELNSLPNEVINLQVEQVERD